LLFRPSRGCASQGSWCEIKDRFPPSLSSPALRLRAAASADRRTTWDPDSTAAKPAAPSAQSPPSSPTSGGTAAKPAALSVWFPPPVVSDHTAAKPVAPSARSFLPVVSDHTAAKPVAPSARPPPPVRLGPHSCKACGSERSVSSARPRTAQLQSLLLRVFGLFLSPSSFPSPQSQDQAHGELKISTTLF